MIQPAKLLVLLAATIALLTPVHAQAQKMWVAGRDFVANEKPDAPREMFPTNSTVSEWSYGSRSGPVASRALTLVDRTKHSNKQGGYEDFEGFVSNGDMLANTGTQPLVMNFGFGDLHPLQPSEMYVGPASSLDPVVVRWTAPVTGSYRISAAWRDLDNHGGNGASGHLVINGTERFGQEWDNDGAAQLPAQTFALKAGDVVDFCLGARGEYSFDATAFNATIKPEGFDPAASLANTGFTVFDRLQPIENAADAVLTFASAQGSTAATLSVRVQATTTPGNASSWAELPDGNFGLMVRDVSTGLWVLNSTNYPHKNGLYFRAVSVAAELSPNIGNVVGPFNLASNLAHVGPSILRVNEEAEPTKISPGEILSFDVQAPAGVGLAKVQSSSTPHDEGSWTDLPGGDLGQTSNPEEYAGATGVYPFGSAVYLRAVATKSDAIASVSNIVGPFDFNSAVNPKLTGLWDAGRDFRINEKPDRPAEAKSVNASVPEWSYGYRGSAASTAFTKYSSSKHSNAIISEEIEGFSDGANLVTAINTGDAPYVRNAGFGDHKPVYPGQLLLHPSSSNAFPVVRWTAPAAGSYRIVAKWIDLDPHGGNGASAHVVINGREVFGREVPADSAGPKRFVGQEWDNGGNAAMPAQTFKLRKDDIVEFLVGSRGEYTFDSTSFNAAIRKVATVTIPNVKTESFTFEGADLDLPVEVTSVRAIRKVTLLLDGQIAAEDLSAPYILKYPNIRSGTHYLSVVALDDAEVESVSRQLKLTVLKNANASADMEASSGAVQQESTGEVTAAATGGRTYTCKQSGIWTNPATWGGAGVPGAADDAIIGRDLAVSVQGNATVSNLEASGSVVIGTPSAIGTLQVNNVLQVSGQIEGAGSEKGQLFILNKLSCLAGQTVFRNLVVDVGLETVVTGIGGIGSSNCDISARGTTRLFSPPGTNRPTVAAVDQFKQAGGSLFLDRFAQLNARAGLVGNDGASISGIISRDGAGLIGQDGNSLRGPNGAPLVGLDGATLVGLDGGTLVGLDGGSMVAAGGGNFTAPGARSAPDDASVATAGGPSGITLESGTVSGKLNFIGNVVNGGAFITPGDPTGKITISGNYTQESGATLVLEVGGTRTEPLDFDQLQIGGTATLGGSLIVNTINGFKPKAGDIFAPLTYGSLNGKFDKVSSNAQVSLGADGMTLQVAGPNPPASKAVNISTRALVGTAAKALIAGFYVSGSGSKKVMIRALGPSLSKQGITGTLNDPTLELDPDNAATRKFNDDWKSGTPDMIPTGFAPSDQREAVIIATLPAGFHTAVVSGKGSFTGVSIVEVYDLESTAPESLANISTRGYVQKGDNVMIAGFIITGNEPAKVLLRGIGPSLPVEGALKDPQLELVNANGGRISNDNWRETQEAEIASTGVPPTKEAEAAIIATLVPGSYTAILRGKDDSTGVALVEGYVLQ